MERDLKDLACLLTDSGSRANVKDPELDILSEKFNPLRALYDKEFYIVSNKSNILYQNMAAFETAYKNVGIMGVGKGFNAAKQTQNKNLDEEVQPTRRFQEHQMPMKTNNIGNYNHRRNVLAKMEQCRGPSELLHQLVKSKQRVRITTRREHGIKGYLEAYLQGFDNHWNLLLSDVVECNKNRKSQYVQQNIVLTETQTSDSYRRLRQIGITPPEETAENVNRKNAKITKIVPQLLLRGEQVVMIHPADKDI